MAAEYVLNGDKPAICITEPDAGNAATEMTTRADKEGDKAIINGKKHSDYRRRCLPTAPRFRPRLRRTR